MTTMIDRRDELGDLVETTPVSLCVAVERSLSIAEWSEVGRRLGRIGNAALWWVGDWFSIGEKTYGSTYSEAMAITGLAYSTLANLASVAQAVGSSRRRELLSFAHHAEVASLSPAAQEEWLERAVSEGMTRETLRSRIRDLRETSSLPTLPFQFRLAAEPDRAQRWKAAAESQGLEFVEWAAAVLDEAAGPRVMEIPEIPLLADGGIVAA